MSNITLKRVQNIQTLALGYNYEGSIDIKDDVVVFATF